MSITSTRKLGTSKNGYKITQGVLNYTGSRSTWDTSVTRGADELAKAATLRTDVDHMVTFDTQVIKKLLKKKSWLNGNISGVIQLKEEKCSLYYQK
ncbi:hypothetical protein CEXT_436341 [Caerostris extrusa]|uniref:Uncharacterized protein n=1 Tax=Caerostris extrusa TaxID=172846 RepID=A0AAV4VA09_CAEEX|nr:hypothetical protein CEXT_436341 [Caerostris extrusa]